MSAFAVLSYVQHRDQDEGKGKLVKLNVAIERLGQHWPDRAGRPKVPESRVASA